MTRRAPRKRPVHYRKIDDAELVVLAQQELPYQTRAYETLLQRHEQVLYAVCLRLIGNQQDAEDVAQDVMLKVFTAIQKFEGRAAFKTWLLRIARNACADRVKKKVVSERHADSFRYETPDHSEQVYEEDHMLTLLGKMEQNDREILTLRYVADFSLNEIAEITDLSLSAAKMRLYRATDKLRELAKAGGVIE